ncbi:hypothetical protein NDN08_003568 [Rhodosorus marinus]|uniref:Uncharacterized protein n=1 Tax=Rhodosorus marinus TaxID=101924 RepID=A0AAV8UWX0_9RHOD|nr:hypothetical protein NDN08_003568 [Rhodosorus marinus]
MSNGAKSVFAQFRKPMTSNWEGDSGELPRGDDVLQQRIENLLTLMQLIGKSRYPPLFGSEKRQLVHRVCMRGEALYGTMMRMVFTCADDRLMSASLRNSISCTDSPMKNVISLKGLN